jgi:hypothetical protein
MIFGKKQVAFVVAMICLALPALAQADEEFGFAPGSVSVTALRGDGSIETQAGAHPDKFVVNFDLNVDEATGEPFGGDARDVLVRLPPGFIGNPQSIPQCPRAEFEGTSPHCSGDTQVGILRANVVGLGEIQSPLYNLTPPPGLAAKLGFSLFQFSPFQEASVDSDNGYGLVVAAPNIPLTITNATETIWGSPSDASHDFDRVCGAMGKNAVQGCAAATPRPAYLTLPTSCGRFDVSISIDSKAAPNQYVTETVPMRNGAGDPEPLTGCDGVPFTPKIAAQPTARAASNPSGLDFELNLPNQGLLGSGAVAESEPRKTVVTLPVGVTVNPALADGIGVCSPAQYAAEKIDSAPGAGCPEASKLGSVIAQTPLLEEPVEGAVYLATPFDNPFGTLTALYLVARAPERGVIVKQAGKVEFDQVTGQITTTFDDLPPIPYSSFKLHFREGARAPLATPAACGEYETVARMTPFSASDDSEAVTATGSFQIERGADGGACPSGGVPSFHPGLTAGTLNNAAGRYSPFNLRLTRTDAEQEFTHFSIKLPPGLVGKLAGIPFCPDVAIEAARGREHNGGAGAELAFPSCPAASQIGRTLVGAGVGTGLTYVPGSVYLAGPYNGSALSIVAITAAKVGPFDVGTVVIREALKVNPETAEVFIDAANSDPIPHIIEGVPVHARDIRVYTDRPEFTLNPTSCQRTSTASTVLGSGLNFSTEADDQPVTVTSPFQAADCASLKFKPKLAISLKGGTKRNSHPALKAVVTYPKGNNANIRDAQVTLPHSEFLENAHIKTICTRVQFKEGLVPGEKCPAASIYGKAHATTPLLDEPLSGPVYLRSSNHPLPDLVVALNSGKINIDLVGRIDSVNGRIRNTFEALPDAPVSKFVLEMQGGKKGLLVNSTNICRGAHRAKLAFTGQNGKVLRLNPAVKAQCGGKGGR